MAPKNVLHVINKITFLLISGSACISAPISAVKTAHTECVGSEQAKNFAIYLHGQDSREPSEIELGNRRNLSHLAESLDFRIALPRATKFCPNHPDQLCWGWKFDRQVAEQSFPTLKKAAQDCFPRATEIGLIGFSNGGYLVNQVFQDQLVENFTFHLRFFLSIGSSLGSWKKNDEKKQISSKIPLILLVGLHDIYNGDPKDAYFNFLKTRGASVLKITFDGGHVVPDEPTISAVRSTLKSFID